MSTPVGKAAPVAPLADGVRSDDVTDVQKQLIKAGFDPGKVDGIWGPLTRKALVAFQKSSHLSPANGALDAATRQALSVAAADDAKPDPQAANTKGPVPEGWLGLGSTGKLVEDLQRSLNREGLNSGTPDGHYGWQTKIAVGNLQERAHVSHDGRAGADTWNALGGDQFRQPPAAAPAAPPPAAKPPPAPPPVAPPPPVATKGPAPLKPPVKVGAPQGAIPPERSVAMLGDSITANGGYGKDLAGHLPDWRFDNYGIVGNRTDQMSGRLNAESGSLDAKTVDLSKYKTLVLLGGVNDIAGGRSLSSIEANLTAMYDRADKAGVRVIPMTVGPWKGYPTWTPANQATTEKLNDFIRNEAKKRGYPVVDLAEALSAKNDQPPGDPAALSKRYRGDGTEGLLHPGAAGQRQIGELLYQAAFKDPGKLPDPVVTAPPPPPPPAPPAPPPGPVTASATKWAPQWDPKTFTASQVGALSSKYESAGEPGAIGFDSTGGMSYGTYQLATKTGAPQHFVAWLSKAHPDLAAPLLQSEPGSAQFGTAWKALAQKSPAAFADAQTEYIKTLYFDPAAQNILKQTGIDISKAPLPLQQAMFSTAVQHGTGGAATIFQKALALQTNDPRAIRDWTTNGHAVDTGLLIHDIYVERGVTSPNGGLLEHFVSSTSQVQASAAHRFSHERTDALTEYLGPQLALMTAGQAANTQVTTFTATDTLAAIRAKLVTTDPKTGVKSFSADPAYEHVGYPIVGADGKLVGVLDVRDLLNPSHPNSATAASILKRAPVVIHEGDTLQQAARLMATQGVGRLPVVSADGKLLGIVSQADLLKSRTAGSAPTGT